MGRRIYDTEGNFVWKYSFGRQPSEMCRYAEEFDIGNYLSEFHKEDADGNYLEDDADHFWNVTKGDLKKLEELYNKLLNGKTEDELNEIGMKAVKAYVEVQNTDWKKYYETDLVWVYTAKSPDDFKYFGCGGQVYSFDIYDIFAKAVEKEISCSFDFLNMTKAFITYIKSKRQKEFCFIDEY